MAFEKYIGTIVKFVNLTNMTETYGYLVEFDSELKMFKFL